MRVEAYWNLHKQCVSYRRPGGPVQYTQAAHLAEVRFAVQPAGRQKVLQQQRRNVHAFVRGTLTSTRQDTTGLRDTLRLNGWRQARYNPYEAGTFIDLTAGRPIHWADEAWVFDRQVWLR